MAEDGVDRCRRGGLGHGDAGLIQQGSWLPVEPAAACFSSDNFRKQGQVKNVAELAVDGILGRERLVVFGETLGENPILFVRFTGVNAFTSQGEQFVLAEHLDCRSAEGEGVPFGRGLDLVIVEREPPAEYIQRRCRFSRVELVEVAGDAQDTFFQAEPHQFHVIVGFDQRQGGSRTRVDSGDGDSLRAQLGTQFADPGFAATGRKRLAGRSLHELLDVG